MVFTEERQQFLRPSPFIIRYLQLGTSSHECLASLVALVLLEVLDEATSQVLSLLVPLSSVSISVTGVKDVGVYTLQLCGHLEVEVRNLLRGSLQDSTAQDGIDDTTSVADRDTLASAVPSGIYQISFGTALLHALYQLLSILSGVQLEECLSEASREGRSGLSDAALCTGQLGGEAREEVVLGLLRSQDAHGRQYAEGIGRQEDDVLSLRTCALAVYLLGNLLDVVALDEFASAWDSKYPKISKS